MKVTKNSTPRVMPEDGTHIAILTQIIDWGTVTDSYGSRRKAEFIWETPELTYEFKEGEGEKPFILDRKFSMTLGRGSKLLECLSGMTGKKIDADELDLEDFLLTTCMISIQNENDGTYDNTIHNSYSPLGKTDAKRKFKPVGPVGVLDLDNFDEEFFKQLPEWKQLKIAESPEYKAIMGAKASKAKQAPVKSAPAKQAPAKTTKKAGQLFK